MKIMEMEGFGAAYAGKRCFMIGTGPTLTYEMLDSLKDEFTFGMNNISVAYPHTEWRPTFYVNVSRSLQKFELWQERAIESIAVAKHSFLWSRYLPWAFQHLPEEEMGSVSFMSCHSHPVFEGDCWEAVSRFGTSMFTCLQLAVYMGFQKIYLVGCDLGFIEGMDEGEKGLLKDKYHFTDDYLGEDRKAWVKDVGHGTLMVDEYRTLITHQITALVTRDINRWVYTCSPRLKSIYPYVELEEVLKE